MTPTKRRSCVLVLAGQDPSGGAGISADIMAIAAQGAHALPVITALTVQDNNQVSAVHPVSPDIIRAQVQTLCAMTDIPVVKLGIIGDAKNALLIAELLQAWYQRNPKLQVVLDPVLGSGRGDALAREEARQVLAPLLPLATLITPNLPEAARLSPQFSQPDEQARALLQGHCRDVFLKGGHDDGDEVVNRWWQRGREVVREKRWPRLAGEFHGSGCTLAAAIAGRLAMGLSVETALQLAQSYTQASLRDAFFIAPGQAIPQRHQ